MVAGETYRPIEISDPVWDPGARGVGGGLLTEGGKNQPPVTGRRASGVVVIAAGAGAILTIATTTSDNIHYVNYTICHNLLIILRYWQFTIIYLLNPRVIL